MITKIVFQCLQNTTYFHPSVEGESDYIQSTFLQINAVAKRLERLSYFCKYLDEHKNTYGFDIVKACQIWMGEMPSIKVKSKKTRIYSIQYLSIHETIK